MRVLIETHHPSDIHFWKHVVAILQERGHDALVLSRDRDVMVELLESYPWIRYKIISSLGGSNRFPLAEFVQRQIGVLRSIISFRPALVASAFGSYAQFAGLMGLPNIIFTDSEFQHFNHKIAHPFATRIYTPRCFWKPLGGRRKWIKYPGYHELAFASPARFSPDSRGLEEILSCGLGRYVLIRLSAWNTLHDIGERGMADSMEAIVVDILERGLRPVIVAEEKSAPESLRQYCPKIPAARYHDVLAFARVVLTEGASTASEAACMGVFAIYANTTSRGYLDDIEARYGLARTLRDPGEARAALRSYLDDPLPARELADRARRMEREHCDVSEFVAEALEREGRGRAL